jgi:hypothetical protein
VKLPRWHAQSDSTLSSAATFRETQKSSSPTLHIVESTAGAVGAWPEISVVGITQSDSGERYFYCHPGIREPERLSTAVVDTARLRKPIFVATNASFSGRVVRDERGIAVWQWNHDREEANGSLHHLALSVEDDPKSSNAKIKPRPAASKSPYDIDRTENSKRRQKRDLRALSRHIAEQRKRGDGEHS